MSQFIGRREHRRHGHELDSDTWVDVLWMAVLAVVLLITGTRLLQSTAWKRVLELTPGGRLTLVTIVAVAALVAVVCAVHAPRLVSIPLFVVAVWCFLVAGFQMYAAVNDPTGPLGFFAWAHVGWTLGRRAIKIT